MRAIGPGLAWIALGLACSSACEKSKASGELSAGSAAAVPSSAPRAAPSGATPASEPRVTASVPRAKPGCRALTVTGVATVEGVRITASGLLDGAHWVELAAGSSIALRHTQSSREFKLIGPAHALPCRDGTEQILLADGQLSTSKNLGARPGAEVLIATPEGIVHYGDAALDLELGDKGLRLRVKQGEAWLEPKEQGKPEFDNPVRSGAEARLPRRRLKAQTLVEACQSAAETANQSARSVLSGEDPASKEPLGARAAAHIRERSKARTACAIAAAAAFTERDPAMRQKLAGAVAHADELWQSVPHAPHSSQRD